MLVAATILSVLLALGIAFSGGRKIAGPAAVKEEAAHLGVPFPAYRAIGILEVLATLGLLVGIAWWLLAVTAAGGLVLLLIGAVGSHLRVKDPAGKWSSAAVLAVIAIAVVVTHLLAVTGGV